MSISIQEYFFTQEHRTDRRGIILLHLHQIYTPFPLNFNYQRILIADKGFWFSNPKCGYC